MSQEMRVGWSAPTRGVTIGMVKWVFFITFWIMMPSTTSLILILLQTPLGVLEVVSLAHPFQNLDDLSHGPPCYNLDGDVQPLYQSSDIN